MNTATVSRHQCPWPKCARPVPDLHWGCIEHWNKVPITLRDLFRRTYDRGAGWNHQSTECDEARARIQQWIDEHTALPEPASIAARADDAQFAAGVTTEGRVFMLWPLSGEYLTLTKEESTLLVRAVRAMLMKGTEP